MMAPVLPTQLTLDEFMSRYRRLLEQLIKEHAHGEVVVTLQDGQIRLLRVNRSYHPSALPQTPPR